MKTINCAECNVEYTYEPAKGYPDNRKYCANCSEKKQATWDKAKETAKTFEPEPTATGKSEFETVDMNPEKPKKSYELTDGNIRIGALTCAIEVSKAIGKDLNLIKTLEDYAFLIEIDSKFEEYIRNGK